MYLLSLLFACLPIYEKIKNTIISLNQILTYILVVQHQIWKADLQPVVQLQWDLDQNEVF